VARATSRFDLSPPASTFGDTSPHFLALSNSQSSISMTDTREIQTDVARRAALDTGAIRPRRAPGGAVAGAAGTDGVPLDSTAYLASVEEEWNKRIDADMDVLVEGMVDLVGLASVRRAPPPAPCGADRPQIGDKDKFRIAQEAFQAQCRAESMVCLPCLGAAPTAHASRLSAQVRAAHSLLSITHSMKLLLLLADETEIATRREAELETVRAETSATKVKVGALLDELLGNREAE
jgi:mediator of RNA polymerase II transcription subunit 22